MGKAEVNLNLIYCHDPKQARDKEILANAEALKEFGLTLTEAQECAYEQNLGSLLALGAEHKVKEPISALKLLIQTASLCSVTGTQSHRTLGLIMAANRILVSHFPFTSPLEQEEQEEWLQQIKSIRSNHRKAQVSMHNGMPVSLLSMELMLLEATFASMPLKDELSKMAQTTVKIVTGVTLSVLKMQLDASLFPALKEGVGHLGRWAGRTYAKRNLFQLMPVRHLDLGGATRSYSRAAETLQKLQGELAQPGVRWEALVSLAMALTNTIVGSATSSVLQLPAEVVLTICGRPEEGLFQLVRFGIEEQDRANTPRAICGLWADALASAVSSDHTGDLQVSHLDAPFLLIEQQVAEATQTLSKWLAAWSKASSEPHKKADKSELEQLRKALVDMLKDIVEFLTKPLKQLCKDICRVVSKLCSPNPDRHRAGGVARRLQKAAAEAFDSHCAQLLDDDNRANDSHSMLEELAVLECVLGTVCDNTTYKERLCSLMAKACNIPSEINRSHLSKNAPPPARTREREEGCLQLICKQVEEMHELLETAQHDAQSQLTSATKGSSINALEKFWSHEDDPQLPMVHAFASHLEGKNGKTSTARKLISILQRCAYRARALRCHFRAELIAEIGEIQASSQQQSELATLVANIKEIALNELRQLIEQAKEHCCDGYEEMVESLGVDDVLSCPLIEDAVKLTKQYIGSVAAQRKSERWRVREVAALCLHRVAIAIRQALSDAAKERAGSSDDAPTSTSVSPEVQAAFIQIQEKIEKEIEFRTYVEPCKRVQHILRSGAQAASLLNARELSRRRSPPLGKEQLFQQELLKSLRQSLSPIQEHLEVIIARLPKDSLKSDDGYASDCAISDDGYASDCANTTSATQAFLPSSHSASNGLPLDPAPASLPTSPPPSLPPSPPSSSPQHTRRPPPSPATMAFQQRPCSAAAVGPDDLQRSSSFRRRLAEAKEVWPHMAQNEIESAIREEERAVCYMKTYGSSASRQTVATHRNAPGRPASANGARSSGSSAEQKVSIPGLDQVHLQTLGIAAVADMSRLPLSKLRKQARDTAKMIEDHETRLRGVFKDLLAEDLDLLLQTIENLLADGVGHLIAQSTKLLSRDTGYGPGWHSEREEKAESRSRFLSVLPDLQEYVKNGTAQVEERLRSIEQLPELQRTQESLRIADYYWRNKIVEVAIEQQSHQLGLGEKVDAHSNLPKRFVQIEKKLHQMAQPMPPGASPMPKPGASPISTGASPMPQISTGESPMPQIPTGASPMPQISTGASPMPQIPTGASPMPQISTGASPMPQLGNAVQVADGDLLQELATLFHLKANARPDSMQDAAAIDVQQDKVNQMAIVTANALKAMLQLSSAPKLLIKRGCSIDVTWDPVAFWGIDFQPLYEVQVSEDVSNMFYTVQDGVSIPKCTLTNLKRGSSYMVRIRARAAHAIADWSPVSQSLLVPGVAAPQPPTANVMLDNMQCTIDLKWRPPRAMGCKIAGYKVRYRYTDDAGVLISDVITIGVSTSYTFTSCKPATDYMFQLQAIADDDSNLTSEWSEESTSCLTPGVYQPADLIAKPISESGRAQDILLSWSQATAIGCAVLCYEVEVSDDNGRNFVPAGVVNGLNYCLNDCQRALQYVFQVRACTDVGLISSWSQPSESVSVPGIAAIDSLAAEIELITCSIQLTWTAARAEHCTVESYEIQRVDDHGHSFTTESKTDQRSWMKRNCQHGVQYGFRVRAHAGTPGLTSPWSKVVTATIPGVARPAPPSIFGVDESTASIFCTWVVPDATGCKVEAHELQISEDGGKLFDQTIQVAQGTSYEIQNCARGQPYKVRVRALARMADLESRTVNEQLALPSITSAWSMASEAHKLPSIAQPATASAHLRDRGIDVKWQPPESDGCMIARYELQHCIDGVAPWMDVALNDGLQTTFRLEPIRHAESHSFRVCAVSNIGFKSPWSVGSDPVGLPALSVIQPPEAQPVAGPNEMCTIRISWNAVNALGQASSGALYELQYVEGKQNNDRAEVIDVGSGFLPVTLTQNTFVEMTNCQRGVPYMFRVRMLTAQKVPASAWSSLSRPAALPGLTRPTAIRVEPAEEPNRQLAFRVRWGNATGMGCHVVKYEVKIHDFKPIESLGSTDIEGKANNPSSEEYWAEGTSCEVQGCRRLSWYTFRVRAIGESISDGSVLHGPFSHVSEPVQLPGIFRPRSISAGPSAMSFSSNGLQSTGSFCVTWEAAQSLTIDVKSYIVQYTRDTMIGKEGEVQVQALTGATKLSCDVIQCDRGVNYQFRVIATGEHGIESMPSEWSEACAIPLLPTPATPDAKRRDEVNHAQEIEVRWQMVQPIGKCELKGYEIERSDGRRDEVTRQDSVSFMWANCTRGEGYQFRVRAVGTATATQDGASKDVSIFSDWSLWSNTAALPKISSMTQPALQRLSEVELLTGGLRVRLTWWTPQTQACKLDHFEIERIAVDNQTTTEVMKVFSDGKSYWEMKAGTPIVVEAPIDGRAKRYKFRVRAVTDAKIDFHAISPESDEIQLPLITMKKAKCFANPEPNRDDSITVKWDLPEWHGISSDKCSYEIMVCSDDKHEQKQPTKEDLARWDLLSLTEQSKAHRSSKDASFDAKIVPLKVRENPPSEDGIVQYQHAHCTRGCRFWFLVRTVDEETKLCSEWIRTENLARLPKVDSVKEVSAVEHDEKIWVSWAEPHCVGGKTVGYEIGMVAGDVAKRKPEGPANFIPMKTFHVQRTEWEPDDAEPAVHYAFAVRGYMDQTNGPWGEWSTQSNPVCLQGAAIITNLNVNVTSASSVLVQWRTPETSDCTITKYEVQLIKERQQVELIDVQPSDNDKQETVISGLEAGEYGIQVRTCSVSAFELSKTLPPSNWTSVQRFSIRANNG